MKRWNDCFDGNSDYLNAQVFAFQTHNCKIMEFLFASQIS